MRKEVTDLLLRDFGYDLDKAVKKVETTFGGRPYEELSPDEKVRYEKLMEKNIAFAEWFIADERKVIVDCLRSITEEVYEVRMGRKYPVLRPPGKERFVRFKTLGKRYTPEAIQTRILYPQFNRCFVENLPRVQYGRLHGGKPRRKLTGLRALYYRYLYELGALPRKPRRPSYAVRQDAYKLDQRIRQMEFLSKHNIDTLEQLETHRKALQTEIGQLQTKRKQLPKTDDVQSQCESVNTALKQLRQEERLCRKIAEHSLEVQQHLTEARRDRAEQQKQEQERARDRRPDITTR